MPPLYSTSSLLGRTSIIRFWLNIAALIREAPMPALAHRHRVVMIGVLIAGGLLLSMYWAGRLAGQRVWLERSQEAGGQLERYAQANHTPAERVRAGPAPLALDSATRDPPGHPADPPLRH